MAKDPGALRVVLSALFSTWSSFWWPYPWLGESFCQLSWLGLLSVHVKRKPVAQALVCRAVMQVTDCWMPFEGECLFKNTLDTFIHKYTRGQEYPIALKKKNKMKLAGAKSSVGKSSSLKDLSPSPNTADIFVRSPFASEDALHFFKWGDICQPLQPSGPFDFFSLHALQCAFCSLLGSHGGASLLGGHYSCSWRGKVPSLLLQPVYCSPTKWGDMLNFGSESSQEVSYGVSPVIDSLIA